MRAPREQKQAVLSSTNAIEAERLRFLLNVVSDTFWKAGFFTVLAVRLSPSSKWLNRDQSREKHPLTYARFLF